jgi:hypothetical protein
MLLVARATPDDADEPFLRSLLDNAPFFRNELLCPVPGVRLIAFLPAVDTTVVPPAMFPHIPLVEVSGFHGRLIDRPAVLRTLVDFLTGEKIASSRTWTDLPLQRAGQVWQAPALAVKLNPVWRGQDASDISFRAEPCPSWAAQLSNSLTWSGSGPG